MKIAKIIYKGGLRTEATHLRSGTKVITDAPIDNQGKGEAFSPTDLIATALGSCMLTIMGIKARDNGMNIEEMSMNITKIMGSNPRKIDEIIIEFDYIQNTLSKKEQLILERAAKTCPVALSLNKEIKQTVKFK